ncbi:MAG: hypothetical protein RBU25_19980, partial [Lentisphaeria bacterium]|nr:hypothetical protein [Lentisphaeria bacterium]
MGVIVLLVALLLCLAILSGGYLVARGAWRNAKEVTEEAAALQGVSLEVAAILQRLNVKEEGTFGAAAREMSAIDLSRVPPDFRQHILNGAALFRQLDGEWDTMQRAAAEYDSRSGERRTATLALSFLAGSLSDAPEEAFAAGVEVAAAAE